MYKNNTSTDLINKLKKPLLLQGPIGYFFSDLMEQFLNHGSTPYKINFNGGDRFFTYKHLKNIFDFKEKMEDFENYLKVFLVENQIDGIVLFGDCRPLHKIAVSMANTMGIEVFVFEEGYIRPNYVTLEVSGVNANSILMDTIESELSKYKVSSSEINQQFTDSNQLQKKHFHTMKDLTKIAALYWLFLGLGKKDYPHYEHHKDGDIFQSAKYWFRSYWKKKIYKLEESNIEIKVTKEWHKKYFLVALQVYNDSQIKEHSKFRNNKKFIYNTVKSFAKFAYKDDMLIIKQHPLDVPYHDYTRFIEMLVKGFNLDGRVHYVHDLNLPVLLKNSKGLVTINSTTGLSALYHKIPVIALGRAMYDVKGLCFQKDINAFWRQKHFVNYDLFKKFRSFLINKTQIVGSFYNKEEYPQILKPLLVQNVQLKNNAKEIIQLDRVEIDKIKKA